MRSKTIRKSQQMLLSTLVYHKYNVWSAPPGLDIAWQIPRTSLSLNFIPYHHYSFIKLVCGWYGVVSGFCGHSRAASPSRRMSRELIWTARINWSSWAGKMLSQACVIEITAWPYKIWGYLLSGYPFYSTEVRRSLTTSIHLYRAKTTSPHHEIPLWIKLINLIYVQLHLRSHQHAAKSSTGNIAFLALQAHASAINVTRRSQQ